MDTIKLEARGIQYAAEAAGIEPEAISTDLGNMVMYDVATPAWVIKATADELMTFSAALVDYYEMTSQPILGRTSGASIGLRGVTELGKRVVVGPINFGTGRMTLAFQHCELVGEL